MLKKTEARMCICGNRPLSLFENCLPSQPQCGFCIAPLTHSLFLCFATRLIPLSAVPFSSSEPVCNNWTDADRSSFGDEPLELRKHKECQRIGRKRAAPREADDAAVDNPLQLVEPDGRRPDEDPTRNVSEACVENHNTDFLPPPHK